MFIAEGIKERKEPVKHGDDLDGSHQGCCRRERHDVAEQHRHTLVVFCRGNKSKWSPYEKALPWRRFPYQWHGHRWIPLTKGQYCRNLMFCLFPPSIRTHLKEKQSTSQKVQESVIIFFYSSGPIRS